MDVVLRSKKVSEICLPAAVLNSWILDSSVLQMQHAGGSDGGILQQLGARTDVRDLESIFITYTDCVFLIAVVILVLSSVFVVVAPQVLGSRGLQEPQPESSGCAKASLDTTDSRPLQHLCSFTEVLLVLPVLRPRDHGGQWASCV